MHENDRGPRVHAGNDKEKPPGMGRQAVTLVQGQFMLVNIIFVINLGQGLRQQNSFS